MNRILKYDLISLTTYAILVTFGIINVYSSSYNELFTSIFDYTTLVGKQLTDHSTFIAFAPADDPKIAVSVFIENGYWGSRWAAPIASLIIEKYLKEDVGRKWLENRMVNGSLIDEYEKPYKFENFSINE